MTHTVDGDQMREVRLLKDVAYLDHTSLIPKAASFKLLVTSIVIVLKHVVREFSRTVLQLNSKLGKSAEVPRNRRC